MKKNKIAPVKMWAIVDGNALSKMIDGTMELYKSKRQVEALLRDFDDVGMLPRNVYPVEVLVTPAPRRRK